MESIRKITVNNDLGLHARAAARIVELAEQFESSLFITRDRKEVDGRSILAILTLACPKGTEIEARAVGEDSEALLEALGTLLGQNFGENK